MSASPESRQAFRDFLALLERADTEFLSPERNVTEDADIAEGEHRCLGRQRRQPSALRAPREGDIEQPRCRVVPLSEL